VAGHDVALEPQAVRRRIGVASKKRRSTTDRAVGSSLPSKVACTGWIVLRSATRVAEVLDLVDLGGAIDRRISTYSGGMKRRLDLAAALIHNPEVLFLDEPTTGLDPMSRAAAWREIRRLNAELGMTIFLTTQYLDEADVLADRVGIIARGRLVAEGTPESLKRSIGRDLIVAEVGGSDPSVVRSLENLRGVDAVTSDQGRIVVSTGDGPAELSSVAIALHNATLEVKSLTLRTPTLDDVFMELTGSHISAAARR
jgi:ABC-2 type transport system ATP-binding protein